MAPPKAMCASKPLSKHGGNCPLVCWQHGLSDSGARESHVLLHHLALGRHEEVEARRVAYGPVVCECV